MARSQDARRVETGPEFLHCSNKSSVHGSQIGVGRVELFAERNPGAGTEIPAEACDFQTKLARASLGVAAAFNGEACGQDSYRYVGPTQAMAGPSAWT